MKVGQLVMLMDKHSVDMLDCLLVYLMETKLGFQQVDMSVDQ
jgi:hypothetical protein